MKELLLVFCCLMTTAYKACCPTVVALHLLPVDVLLSKTAAMYLIHQLFSSPECVIPKAVKEPVRVDSSRHDLHPNISAVVFDHDGAP